MGETATVGTTTTTKEATAKSFIVAQTFSKRSMAKSSDEFDCSGLLNSTHSSDDYFMKLIEDRYLSVFIPQKRKLALSIQTCSYEWRSSSFIGQPFSYCRKCIQHPISRLGLSQEE
jgi:hypothetical protein